MRSPKNLVVDDDNDVCRIVCSMLSHEQYSGPDRPICRRMLSEPSNTIYSLLMPMCWTGQFLSSGSTGYDIAERIRSKGSETPIILISCDNTSSVASRAEKIRIFDFLQKPFSREMMCNAVKKAIGSLPANPPSSVALENHNCAGRIASAGELVRASREQEHVGGRSRIRAIEPI